MGYSIEALKQAFGKENHKTSTGLVHALRNQEMECYVSAHLEVVEEALEFAGKSRKKFINYLLEATEKSKPDFPLDMSALAKAQYVLEEVDKATRVGVQKEWTHAVITQDFSSVDKEIIKKMGYELSDNMKGNGAGL